MLSWITIINVTMAPETHAILTRFTKWRDTIEVDGETVVSSTNNLDRTHVFVMSHGGSRVVVELSLEVSGQKYLATDLVIDGRRVPLETLDHVPDAGS
jgi:hypothetical protein